MRIKRAERDLPKKLTASGNKIVWKNKPLMADTPYNAYQGILDNRNLTEDSDFFHPDMNQIPNPDLMKDMKKGVLRLAKAINNGEKIHIFGDFDADGINSTAILLEALQAFGAKISYSIPTRDEGHGISKDKIREIAKDDYSLCITVDNASSDVEEANLIYENNMELIITDHHKVPPETPRCEALINPDQCGYGDKELCGAGVAYLLINQLADELGSLYNVNSLLDRVAIATVADMMNLVGLNRILVTKGLEILNTNPSNGVKLLIDEAGLTQGNITAEDVAFMIAPRINATGRLNKTDITVALLSNQKDAETKYASQINDINSERKTISKEVSKAALKQTENSELKFAFNKDWHSGVVGLAASELCQESNLPSGVGFIDKEDNIRLSMRAPDGFNVHTLLNDASNLLESFGGHAGAGGGVIKQENWNALLESFKESIKEQKKTASNAKIIEIDGISVLDTITDSELSEEQQKFAPFGRGNVDFTWLAKGIEIIRKNNMKNNAVSLLLSDGITFPNAVFFNVSDEQNHLLNTGDKYDFVISQKINNNGVSLEVKDFIPS